MLSQIIWIFIYIVIATVILLAFWHIVMKWIVQAITRSFRAKIPLQSAFKFQRRTHQIYLFNLFEFIVLAPFLPFALIGEVGKHLGQWIQRFNPIKDKKRFKSSEKTSEKMSDSVINRIQREGLSYKD